MNSRTSRALQGVAIAVGAPLGWLLIEGARGISPAAALNADPLLLLYMLVATMLVFGTFGLVLGSREDRLLEMNRNLEEVAITDPLTGLRNAGYFHARLEEEYAEHVRSGAPLAVAILDLDFFKRVNDEHGHLVGDDVLSRAARAIASVTRHGETEARVGGEEFGLLLPGSTGDAAREAVERARAAIAATETHVTDGRGVTVRVTASGGIASTAELGDVGTHALYKVADDALYRAKAEGRNRTVVAMREDESGDS